MAEEGYPVARVYTTCIDASVMGGGFFIMDFLSGAPMITAPIDSLPAILADIHAALHRIDPDSIARSLTDQGIGQFVYSLGRTFDSLGTSANNLPWISDGVGWLLANRPPESESLCVCHGDFHPMNILVGNDVVTGVVDWGNFLIADRVVDIADTVWLMSIAYKNLTSSGIDPELKSVFGPGAASVDWVEFSRNYLAAYQALEPFDTTHLEYYKIKRSIEALISGVSGQEALRHPLIVSDLIELIHKGTGVRIVMPG